MILPPLILRVRKTRGGNTLVLPGGIFFECFFFLGVFCVMTPGSWESWTNPLDRREELNVAFFSGIESVEAMSPACEPEPGGH